jgi:hypothetical protein
MLAAATILFELIEGANTTVGSSAFLPNRIVSCPWRIIGKKIKDLR